MCKRAIEAVDDDNGQNDDNVMGLTLFSGLLGQTGCSGFPKVGGIEVHSCKSNVTHFLSHAFIQFFGE